MKKKVFSLMMMLLLAFTGFVRADELTVHDGTGTNGYVPVYGFYADAYLKCEMVYPASELSVMNGGQISSMAFGISSPAAEAWTGTFQVFVKEVSDATISDFSGTTGATTVYTGTLDGTGSTMTVNFTTPYTYNGGNLLVGFYLTTTGNYKTIAWAGETVNGASVQGYNYSSLSDVTASQRNFLPKTTFTYEAGAPAGDQLHVKYMANGEEVVDSLNLGTRPMNAWMEPFSFTMYTEGATYTVNVLDFTPDDGIFEAEGQELPFQVVRNNDVDLTIATNATVAGVVERQFVAITEGDRAAHIWPIIVEFYEPAVPDVVELAYDLGEITDGYSYVGVPADITPTTLHNDYDLPFDEIEEGVDAVYKLTFPNDAMLNAYVSQGENGKVALYRDGFEGEGGPMADNYYTGPSANGGGATGGSFEAMIGDETSTTTSTYFPFHTLWNYSIGENLFLASELTEAGVTTAPMTSLSWYVSSTTCTTPQNGISIWMANVSDSELTATSHTTAGMSLVYTGTNVLPVAGEWNEFVFNAGNFAWDGHSNVLVVCQRLNGDWQGSVSWQTHNPGFTAMTYDYDDYEVYDMTSQTYSMYTSTTNRPNIIMKGGSRRAVAGLTSPSRHERGAGHPGARINPNAPAFTPSHNGIQAMLRGSNAYGMQCYGSSATPSMSDGLVNFDVDDFAGTCSLVTSDYYSGGVAYNPNTGHYYIGDYSGYMFYEVDLASGTVVNSMPTYYQIVSLCYNPATNELYGTDTDAYVFYIDPSSIDYTLSYFEDNVNFNYGGMGALDVYDNDGRFPYDLTVGPDGDLYSIVSSYTDSSEDALLVKVNPYTATTTTMATLNRNCWYLQGFDYDANTGVFVWAQEEPAGGSLITINPSTYAMTTVSTGIGEIMGLCIPSASSPTPGPTPAGEMAYGPEIINAAVEAGTYYLVASSTTPGFEVTINAEDMPCPTVEAEGFAFNPTPADDADEVEPASVTLRWNIPAYATGWRLVFGSTYYPDPNHPQTIMYPEDGSFATELANSYTVTNLWNNTNYFWHVEFNNDGCPEGVSSPIWGFTTHLNIPTNLTAVDYTVFDDEQIVLNWNAVVDRTYRFYNVYRDGELIGHTDVNNISNTTYTDGPLAYNMEGYTYYVTAVYDEGESAPSDPVTVKVSGYGDVNGHVYEQDGTTGIAGATVTMVGQDEFGVNHTYNFTTNNQGYYTGHIYAGAAYDGQAAKDGYQTDYEPEQGEPIVINYNQTTSPIDYILDENFDPVCGVIAEYYPDSLDPNSPYVKVYWGCGLPGSEIVEPFETGDFSLFDWQIDPTYPWSITTTAPYEGTYCMKSGGAGVANVVSNMSVTVEIPADGLMSFFGKISCESSWDYGYFYIDGQQRGSYTGASAWGEKTFDITAGTHTFMWQYTKDGSVNSNDDCFYVDYITFYKQPEPAIPGMTYDFENSTMQGWTSVDADGDGYGWMVGSEKLGSTGNGHNGSLDLVLSQSYDNNFGVLYPDNYLVSPQVELGGIVRFYACAQDASYAAEHFGVAVSTTNTQPSSFTMVQEWTMSAKSMGEGKPVEKNTRSGRAQGNWYEYTVDLSAYSGMGYVAIRHFNCSDMFYLDVDDITIGEPGKGIAQTRSLDHYRVYRTNCYNDGPYTAENTVLLATVWVPDTVYIDVEWADLAPGVYKWGVGAVYSGNRGELYESPIAWGQPVAINDNYRVLEGKNVPENNFASVFSTGDLSDYMPQRGNATVILTAGDVWGDGSGYQMLLDADANTYGTTIPETGALSLNCSGNDAIYGQFEYKIPENADGSCSTSNIVINNSVSIEIPAGTYDWCITNPTPGDRIWIAASTGNVGGRENDYVFEEGKVYEFVISMHGSNDGVDVTITDNPTPGPTPGPTPTPGSNLNELALPRESETIWSNCLDKDMYLDHVSVNVLLNSADSPEGTEVTFTNLNEFEQQNYGGYNVTLDGSGYYLWDSFRRGDYAVKVTHIGYEPIDDTVSIWQTTDLRYVMTEIIYGVENVYVSRTGWAMWDPLDPQAGGSGVNPTPGPGGDATTFNVGFEEGMPEGWTRIDANNDGNRWEMTSDIPTAWPYYASLTLDWYRTGTNAICSGSYINGVGAITPDDYLVTPQVTLAAGSTFSFWAAATDANYPAEHFGVFVSDNGTSDWTSVQEWTLTAKSSSKAGDLRASRDGNGNRLGNWHQYSVDLSAYAGQKYIAIRHFNCNDQYIMCVDDIELTAGAKNGGERHLEHYKVMCTSIDGVPIFNHNTVYPFCQLSTNEPYNAPLVEGEHYLCKVAVMYSTGLSEWSEPVEWVYEPCDHWGPVDEVTATTTSQGNHIEWVFEHGFNPYANDTVEPGPQPGQNATIILTAGDVWGDGSGYQMLLDADANAYGTTIPETGALSTACSGNEAIYAQFEYKIPTNADGNCSTQNMVMNNSVSIEIPAGTYDWCITNPTPGDRIWIASAQGNVGGRQNDYTFEAGSTYEFTVTMQGSNDAVNVVITGGGKGGNAPLAAGEVKDIANVTPGNYGYIVRPAYSTSNMIGQNFNMVSETSLMFNIGDIANYDERVYFLYKLMNDSRFSVINGEQVGMFVVNGNADLNANFVDFIAQNISEFTNMDKYQAADMANAYKGEMPSSMVNAMMTDLYVQSRENNMCEFADPFCTDNGMYEFPAGVNAGSGEAGPDYDCLYTQPNPAWYYMRIGDPGAMDIHMYSTPEVDIDFCCWGPFEDPTTPCPNGLTEDKVVSCSYSTSWTEHCMIPATAQTGEYYILVITNYSNQPCNINFSMVAGNGSTDCGILPPTDIIGFLITMDGEYLAFAEPTARDFMHEGEFGEHEYCVRPIYPGEMVLPDHNYGWSMGCPVCASPAGDLCAPVINLVGQYMNNEGTEGLYIDWEDPEGATSIILYAEGQPVVELPVGQHPIFLGFDGQVPEHTFIIGAQAIHPDCESEIVEVEVYYDDVIENEANVALFPNPTNGNVTIQAEGMTHITVASVLGQVVYDADVNGDEMIINMGQFNAGMYMVRINTANGVVVKRVTVMQ